MKAPQRSLKKWGKQKWRTKSGKPSTQGPKATGERYLPSAAIKSLSSAEYAATTKAKQKGKKVTTWDGENRTVEWYHEQFADWNSPAKLYWRWRKSDCDLSRADNQTIINTM